MPKDLIYLGPILCVKIQPWLIWGQKSSSVGSVLSNVPTYIFYRTRPKGVSFPLLRDRNYLVSELPVRLKVSFWRLLLSVKTTRTKGFCHNNHKTLLSKTKGQPSEAFQADHLIYARLPNRTYKFFAESLCISIQQTWPCPGDLARALQLSLKVTNIASIQKKKFRSSGIPLGDTWREILARAGCWRGLLHKHRQLHKNGSSTRAGTMFDSLPCTKSTTRPTVAVLDIVLSEWMNASWLGRSRAISKCYLCLH